MRIPIIMMIIMLLGSVLIDLYITLDIRRSARRACLWKGYALSAVLCVVFIVVVLCLPRRSTSSDILPVMWMLYSILSVYVAKFIYVVFSLIGRLIGFLSRRNRDRRTYGPRRTMSSGGPGAAAMRWIGLFVALVVFGSLWWGVAVTRRQIMVVEQTVCSPKIPPRFDGYRIAQISDLHVGTWGNDTTFISELVDSVNALKPDLIVFTGDIVNRRTDELKPFLPVLSRLHAPDGVLSILGNHDYGDYVDWESPSQREENNRRLASLQGEMGWEMLNNRRVFSIRDNDSIMIVGVENVGDPPFPTYGDLEKALSSSTDSLYHQNDHRFKILLTHNPAHWDEYVSHDTNFDLSLAGHTHAMQIMLKFGGYEWSPAKFRYELWGGMFERKNRNGEPVKLYVNIGAGEVGMPSRLFAAYPEITLFTLRHSK